MIRGIYLDDALGCINHEAEEMMHGQHVIEHALEHILGVLHVLEILLVQIRVNDELQSHLSINFGMLLKGRDVSKKKNQGGGGKVTLT